MLFKFTKDDELISIYLNRLSSFLLFIDLIFPIHCCILSGSHLPPCLAASLLTGFTPKSANNGTFVASPLHLSMTQSFLALCTATLEPRISIHSHQLGMTTTLL